jgi:putative membrane protein insertion efficiency factor
VNRSLPARGLLRTINLYQRLTAHRPSPCRYIPTCSEYARGALEEHGAARGLWLTGRRLARCHPLGGFGFDPVPVRAASSEPATSGTELGLG